MNIISRQKTPFNPAMSIEAKPVKRPFSSYSEKYLAEKMRKMARSEGHEKKLPTSKDESTRNLFAQNKNRRDGTITQAVNDILRIIGPARISEIAEKSDGLTSAQVSTALAALKKGGEAVIISHQATQTGSVTVWKAT